MQEKSFVQKMASLWRQRSRIGGKEAFLHFFEEPRSIIECSEILCRVQFVYCCNSMLRNGQHFVATKGTRLYSFLVGGMLIVLLSLAVALNVKVRKMENLKEHFDTLVLSIAVLEIIMTIVMFIITIFHMASKAKQHGIIYDKVNLIDQILMRDFQADLNYYKLKRKNIVVLAGISFTYGSAVFFSMPFDSLEHYLLLLLFAILYVSVTGGAHFSSYVHMNLCEILGIRFRLLQRIVNKAYLLKRFPKDMERVERIQQAIQMVKDLHYIILDINDVYKVTLMIAIVHDFTLTTSELYMIFGSKFGAQSNDSFMLLIYISMCMMTPLYKIIVAPMYCERTMTDAKICLKNIELLEEQFPGSKDIQRMVADALLWRLQNKIAFKASFNIVIGKHSIAMIWVAIFNYILILIQFRMTQEMSEEVEQQKAILKAWITSI